MNVIKCKPTQKNEIFVLNHLISEGEKYSSFCPPCEACMRLAIIFLPLFQSQFFPFLPKSSTNKSHWGIDIWDALIPSHQSYNACKKAPIS